MFCSGLSGFCYQNLKETTSSSSTRKAIFQKKNNQHADIHAESPEMCTQNALYSLLAFPPPQNYVDFNLQNIARQEMHFQLCGSYLLFLSFSDDGMIPANAFYLNGAQYSCSSTLHYQAK